MFLGAWEGHHRSLVKAISWRVAGSLDTLMLSYLVTRNFVFAGSIASAETVTKIVLYYVHERAWTVVLWGKRPRQAGLPETRFHWRGRVAHGVAAVVNFASPLRPLFDPVKLGIAASFILCFAIVVTPHRFVRPAPLSGRWLRASPRRTSWRHSRAFSKRRPPRTRSSRHCAASGAGWNR